MQQTVQDLPRTRTVAESNEELCRRVQAGDAQAEIMLLQQNEGMIHTIAWRERRRYAYLSLEQEDLWVAGQMGLLRAARMFRQDVGSQFTTYAWPHVRQAVQREIIYCGTVVRVPVHLHDRIHKLSMYREPNTSADYAALAKRVTEEEPEGHGMTESEVHSALCHAEPMLSLRSLDEKLKMDGHTARQEMTLDPDAVSPEEAAETHIFLEQCLSQISEREREVIALRYGLYDGVRLTLSEVGERLGVTKERVRQLESRALGKMRRWQKRERIEDDIA